MISSRSFYDPLVGPLRVPAAVVLIQAINANLKDFCKIAK
jgi:hypothetical protein